MSCFCLNRKFSLAIFFCTLSIVSSCLLMPSLSYAETSWADLLKPLVKDVIVPGASAGMKKLIEKKMKVKLETSVGASGSSSTPSNDGVMSMPEEPSVSTSNSDDIISMPEEPTYSVSASNSGVEGNELAAPPPPVETP